MYDETRYRRVYCFLLVTWVAMVKWAVQFIVPQILREYCRPFTVQVYKVAISILGHVKLGMVHEENVRHSA